MDFVNLGRRMETAMYKKQMILQRVVCYFLLAAAALVFVYSLGIMTDLYDMKFDYYAQDYYNPNIENPTAMVSGTEIYYDMQEFNRTFTKIGIVLILLALSQFVFQNHTRRKYYIANYITVGANTVAGICVTLWALDNIFKYKEQFMGIDFETLKMWSDLFKFYYTESTFWFDISKVVFVVFLVAVAINVINLVWKIILMGAEKKLLSAGKEGAV